MNRRDFLKAGAAASGALVLEGTALAEPAAREEQAPDRYGASQFVREPARRLPVIASADVVVVGGGPAGVAAAIAAARGGSSVILLEKFNYLGGLWTGGMVLPLLSTHGAAPQTRAWTQVVHGISQEICERLFAMKMAIVPVRPVVDPEACKYVLDQMIEEAGVQVLYYVTAAQVSMSGDRIDAVVLECKSGRCAVKARTVVDCSGDGDVFTWAGEEYREQKYHIGVMWRVGNADPYFGSKRPTPVKGVHLLHTRGEEDQDGLDIFNVSRLQRKFRKMMWDRTEEMRKKEGCEDLFLLDTPSQLGIRVTRVLHSRYNVQLEGSMHYLHYEDSIGMSGGSDPIMYQGRKIPARERPYWEIPYRALLPRKCPNLIVAGRCFGYDEGLTWDAREIGTCLVTGQAAGAAAALAVAGRKAFADVDVPTLQKTLKAQNVLLSL